MHSAAIPFVRSLVTGVGMDLAFYLSWVHFIIVTQPTLFDHVPDHSPYRHHREKMTATVVRDANSIHRLFCHRNPGFKGKVSIIGMSLDDAPTVVIS